jgi:methionine-S-sulfoxide reductase
MEGGKTMNRFIFIFIGLWIVTLAPPLSGALGGDDMIGTQTSATGKATFAGGCFWCMEPPFDKLEGVTATISGYTGGHKLNPTYQEVSAGVTGHTEALQVHFDPSITSYAELLEVFWRNINPADADGQFVDRGTQYRPGIFYHNEEQKHMAEESRDTLTASGVFTAQIVVEITPATDFYPAEEYHQDYYQKNPVRYKFYRYNSGRDQFLKKIWGGK